MRVAITGGSGSLGTALLRRLTQSGAERIVVFSRDEQRRTTLAAEFGWHPGFRAYAGDVRDRGRLSDIFRGCDTVIHAAARKVVSGQPDEAEEMLKTNVLGTQNVIEAARQVGVSRLLFISSDKAVHPEAQAYGVSKSMAERLAIAANARTHADGLRVSVLRYGNVLGSRGSVLGIWRDYAERGKPLPISDRRMTRFWLTLRQAVELVMDTVPILRGGEVFVPRLPAAPIERLARAVVGSEIDVQFHEIGIRMGGEKLHEELLSAGEIRRARVYTNEIYVVPPDVPDESRWDSGTWLGSEVCGDMVYRSDTWEWQASVDDLRRLLDEAES